MSREHTADLIDTAAEMVDQAMEQAHALLSKRGGLQVTAADIVRLASLILQTARIECENRQRLKLLDQAERELADTDGPSA